MNLPKLTAEQSLGTALGNYINKIPLVEVSSEVSSQNKADCGCLSKAACNCHTKH